MYLISMWIKKVNMYVVQSYTPMTGNDELVETSK